MGLADTYEKVKDCVVAIGPRYHLPRKPDDKLPLFPHIIGTGVLIGDGLVVTNDHVVGAFSRLPRPPDAPADEWPAVVHVFKNVPSVGMFHGVIPIRGVFRVETFTPGGSYYGPKKPDLAVVELEARGTPFLPIAETEDYLREGAEVATSGFPMGATPLVAPGYVHQLSPILQRGIIGAVLPFPCDGAHAFMIDVMVQGGASGSPVFGPERAEVLGIVYAGLLDRGRSAAGDDFQLPTSYTYVVPARFIRHVLAFANEHLREASTAGLQRFDETLSEALQDPEQHATIGVQWTRVDGGHVAKGGEQVRFVQKSDDIAEGDQPRPEANQ